MIAEYVKKCYHNGIIEEGELAIMKSNLEAVKKYQKKLDSFKIRPSLEEGQKIRQYAAVTKKSIQGLFLKSINEYMTRHPAEEQEKEQEEKKGKAD